MLNPSPDHPLAQQNLERAQDKAGTPADVSLEAPVESDGRPSEDRMLIIAISGGAVIFLPNLARSVRRHSASRATQAANTTSPSTTVPRPRQPGAAALESEAVPLVLVGSSGTESNAVDERGRPAALTRAPLIDVIGTRGGPCSDCNVKNRAGLRFCSSCGCQLRS